MSTIILYEIRIDIRIMAAPQMPLPPMPVIPGAGLQSIDECNQYWQIFKDKLGELHGLAGQDLTVAQKDARTLFRKYNRCIDEKLGPLGLRRTINSDTMAAIRMNLVAGNEPLVGGRLRRRRRITRSRRGCRMTKRGSRRNMRK